MKGNLKFSPVDVLWVMSSRNGTGNNGTDGKISKNGTCFPILGWGLGFEREVWGEDFGFAFGILEFGGWGFGLGGEGLGFKSWGLDVEGSGLSLEKFNISVPNNCGFQQANSSHT